MFTIVDETQAAALLEVTRGDYSHPVSGPVRKIVDLGANAGQAAMYFRDRFPDATVLSVEADPEIARLARQNHRHDQSVTVVSAAVCDHDGSIGLTRLRGYSWGSNLVGAWNPSQTSQVQVRAAKLSSILDEHSIECVDLLKVDIEGAELEALMSDDVLSRVRTVLGEVHPALLGIPGEHAVELLRAHGGFVAATTDGPLFCLSRDQA